MRMNWLLETLNRSWKWLTRKMKSMEPRRRLRKEAYDSAMTAVTRFRHFIEENKGVLAETERACGQGG